MPRIVRNVVGNPLLILSKLNDRYNSKTISCRIFKMSELIYTRCTILRNDMEKHIDKFVGIDPRRTIRGMFDDSLAFGILVASIDVPEIYPATAAMIALPDEDINSEAVSARLIDESKNHKSGNRNRTNGAVQLLQRSIICRKISYNISKSFRSPLNRHNKLSLKLKSKLKTSTTENDENIDEDTADKTKLRWKAKRNKERSSMALINERLSQKTSRLSKKFSI